MLCCVSHITILPVLTCDEFSALLCSVSYMTILFVVTRAVKHEIKRAKRLSQALVHFVTAFATLFADQRMSGFGNWRQVERRGRRHLQAVGICASAGRASIHEVASRSGVGTTLDPHVCDNLCGVLCSFTCLFQNSVRHLDCVV